VLQARIPGEIAPDRLALLNPQFFALDPLLAGMKRKLDLWPIYSIQFLSADATQKTEHGARSPIVWAGFSKQVAEAMMGLAKKQGVKCTSPPSVEIHSIDETGLAVTLGKKRVRAKLLVLAGKLSSSQQRMLGMASTWEPEVVQRYTFLKLRGAKWTGHVSPRVLPMSLDLGGKLFWAWMIPHKQQVQLAVIQPLESLAEMPPRKSMDRPSNALWKKRNLWIGRWPGRCRRRVWRTGRCSSARPGDSIRPAARIFIPIAGRPFLPHKSSKKHSTNATSRMRCIPTDNVGAQHWEITCAARSRICGFYSP
jgi:hypothetical protein